MGMHYTEFEHVIDITVALKKKRIIDFNFPLAYPLTHIGGGCSADVFLDGNRVVIRVSQGEDDCVLDKICVYSDFLPKIFKSIQVKSGAITIRPDYSDLPDIYRRRVLKDMDFNCSYLPNFCRNHREFVGTYYLKNIACRQDVPTILSQLLYDMHTANYAVFDDLIENADLYHGENNGDAVGYDFAVTSIFDSQFEPESDVTTTFYALCVALMAEETYPHFRKLMICISSYMKDFEMKPNDISFWNLGMDADDNLIFRDFYQGFSSDDVENIENKRLGMRMR